MPPQIRGGHKSRQIAHDTASQGQDKGTTFQSRGRQAIVALLHYGQPFGRLTRGHGDEEGVKAGSLQILLNGFSVKRRYLAVRDDRATPAQFEPRASRTQSRQLTGTDQNIIAAVTQGNVDLAHGLA